jgi:capsular polysaccharide biosynthesis protein
METSFKHYWDTVQKGLPLVLLVSAAAALAAWLIVGQVSPSYEVHFSYLISLREREAADEFRFDDYYALSATDLFASTLAEWLSTPEVVVAAYETAGLAVPTAEMSELTRTVTAQKKAPQLVTVVVRGRERERAARAAEGLKNVMERNLEQFQNQGSGAISFTVYPTESWVATKTLSAAVITTATFLFTFLAAVNLIVLRESFRRM